MESVKTKLTKTGFETGTDLFGSRPNWKKFPFKKIIKKRRKSSAVLFDQVEPRDPVVCMFLVLLYLEQEHTYIYIYTHRHIYVPGPPD